MNQSMSPNGPGTIPQTTDFGIFYPVGYRVVAFSTLAAAQPVQRDRMIGGDDPADCLLATSEQVVAGAERNLKDHPGFLARLGQSDEAVQLHLAAAQHGASFLLIYAPGDTDVARAMNVIRRVPFDFVHRYHRFAIENLT